MSIYSQTSRYMECWLYHNRNGYWKTSLESTVSRGNLFICAFGDHLVMVNIKGVVDIFMNWVALGCSPLSHWDNKITSSHTWASFIGGTGFPLEMSEKVSFSSISNELRMFFIPIKLDFMAFFREPHLRPTATELLEVCMYFGLFHFLFVFLENVYLWKTCAISASICQPRWIF